MKYIHAMGGIWKISDRNYKKLKRDLVAGEINLDDYGPMVVSRFEELSDLEAEAYEKQEGAS